MSVSTVPATTPTTPTTVEKSAAYGKVEGQSQSNHNEPGRLQTINIKNTSGICDNGSSMLVIAAQSTAMTSYSLGTSASVPSSNHDESDQHQYTTVEIAEVGGVTACTSAMMATIRNRTTRTATVRRRHRIKEFNDVISCYLCRGYLINATTIDYCVHSFCRSCIIKYLQKDKHCPRCRSGSKQISLSNLRSDERLKSLVFKIVPGLYQNEHQRQVQFYTDNNVNKDEDIDETVICDPEEDYFSPIEPISLSLEYHPQSLPSFDKQQIPPVRYLQCPAAVTVHHLRRFIYSKFDIDPDNQRVDIEIIYKDEILPEDFSLMDVGYCYSWKRNCPMRFFYRILVQSLCNKSNQTVNSDSVLSESDNVIEAKCLEKADEADEAGSQKVVRFKNTSVELKSEKTSENIICEETIAASPTRGNIQETPPQAKYTILKTKNTKNEQRKQQHLISDYLGNNNNNEDYETKDSLKEKKTDESQINGGKGPVKVTIIARKANEIKVKSGRHEKYGKGNNSSKSKNKINLLLQSSSISSEDSVVASDFKSLRSNDIRYTSNFTNNNISNIVASNKHKLSTAKPKTAVECSKSLKDSLQKPVSKCDIVVSIPQSHVHRSSNSSDDSFENLSLAQLKTANKKVNVNTPPSTGTATKITDSSQNTNLGHLKLQMKNESKLKPDVPKLKIELPSLKTKITVPKRSPEIQESKKSPKLRKDSVEEISKPITNQVDLTTYAKNIGLKPINPNLAEKKDNKVKGSAENSPNSSLSSSPPSSVGSGFAFSSDSANLSSHKKRKKGKHSRESKESGSSKRRKLHAEIASHPVEESLKLKVKITANHKSHKSDRKTNGSSNDDVILTSLSTTGNSIPVTSTIINTVSDKLPVLKSIAESTVSSTNLIQDYKPGRSKQGVNVPDLNKTLSEESFNINTLIKENSTVKNHESVGQHMNISQTSVTKGHINQPATITSPSSVVTKISVPNSINQTISPTSSTVVSNPVSSTSKSTSSPTTVVSSSSLVLSVANSIQQILPKTLPSKVLSMQEAKIPISPPLPPSLFKTTPMSLQTLTTTQTKAQSQPLTKVSSTNNDAKSLAISQLNRLTKANTSKSQVNFAIPNPPRSMSNSPKLSSITSIASVANRQVQLKRSASLDGNLPTLAKQQKLEQDRLIRKSAYAPFITQPSVTSSNNMQTTSVSKSQKNAISTTTNNSNNLRITDSGFYTSTMASNYTHEILTRKPLPVLLSPSSLSVTKIVESISNKITSSGLGVTITAQQQTPLLFQQQPQSPQQPQQQQQQQQQQKPALEIVRISSNIPPVDQQPLTVTNNNTVKPNPPKTTRPPPPPIPLVKIRRSNNQTLLKPTLTTVSSSVQQAQLIHSNLSVAINSQPNTTNSATTPPPAISTFATTKSTENNKMSNKNPICDDIGALDLSGKSSRSPSQEKSPPLGIPPQTPTQQALKENSVSPIVNKVTVNSLEAAVNKLKQQNQFSAGKNTISAGNPDIEKQTSSNASESTKTPMKVDDLAMSKDFTKSEAINQNCADNQTKSSDVIPANTNNFQDLKTLTDPIINRERIMLKNQRQLPTLPKLNEINKMRSNATVRQQNASLRNIPNPSALAFRSHQPIPMLASITKTPSPTKSIPTTAPTTHGIKNTTTSSTGTKLVKLTLDSNDKPSNSSQPSANETIKQIPLVATSVSKSETNVTFNSMVSTNVTTAVTSTGIDIVKQTISIPTTTKKNLNIDQLAANLRAAAAADNSSNSNKNLNANTVTATSTTSTLANTMAVSLTKCSNSTTTVVTVTEVSTASSTSSSPLSLASSPATTVTSTVTSIVEEKNKETTNGTLLKEVSTCTKESTKSTANTSNTTAAITTATTATTSSVVTPLMVSALTN